MTLETILSGPVSDRPPHADWPLTDREARHVLRSLEAQMPKGRRGKAARFFADNGRNITDAARNLYARYAAYYGA